MVSRFSNSKVIKGPREIRRRCFSAMMFARKASRCRSYSSHETTSLDVIAFTVVSFYFRSITLAEIAHTRHGRSESDAGRPFLLHEPTRRLVPAAIRPGDSPKRRGRTAFARSRERP